MQRDLLSPIAILPVSRNTSQAHTMQIQLLFYLSSCCIRSHCLCTSSQPACFQSVLTERTIRLLHSNQPDVCNRMNEQTMQKCMSAAAGLPPDDRGIEGGFDTHSDIQGRAIRASNSAYTSVLQYKACEAEERERSSRRGTGREDG